MFWCFTTVYYMMFLDYSPTLTYMRQKTSTIIILIKEVHYISVIKISILVSPVYLVTIACIICLSSPKTIHSIASILSLCRLSRSLLRLSGRYRSICNISSHSKTQPVYCSFTCSTYNSFSSFASFFIYLIRHFCAYRCWVDIGFHSNTILVIISEQNKCVWHNIAKLDANVSYLIFFHKEN